MAQQSTKHEKRHMFTFSKPYKFNVLSYERKMSFRKSFRRKLRAFTEANFIRDRYLLKLIIVEQINGKGAFKNAWSLSQTDHAFNLKNIKP